MDNEDLLIIDIDEIEIGVEYYIKFYDADSILYNDIYKVVNIHTLNKDNILCKSFLVTNLDTFNYFDLVLKNSLLIFKPDIAVAFNIDDKLRNAGNFIQNHCKFDFAIKTICDIYKLPSETEYVLK
jgi:hypothetical protein